MSDKESGNKFARLIVQTSDSDQLVGKLLDELVFICYLANHVYTMHYVSRVFGIYSNDYIFERIEHTPKRAPGLESTLLWHPLLSSVETKKLRLTIGYFGRSSDRQTWIMCIADSNHSTIKSLPVRSETSRQLEF